MEAWCLQSYTYYRWERNHMCMYIRRHTVDGHRKSEYVWDQRIISLERKLLRCRWYRRRLPNFRFTRGALISLRERKVRHRRHREGEEEEKTRDFIIYVFYSSTIYCIQNPNWLVSQSRPHTKKNSSGSSFSIRRRRCCIVSLRKTRRRRNWKTVVIERKNQVVW